MLVLGVHFLGLVSYNYVSLSNIYVVVDRWLDISLVGEKMKERGVRKISSHSYINS